MIKGQLASSLDKCGLTADYCINNENWWAEQKIDGQRILVEINDNQPEFYNRNAQPMNIDLHEDFNTGFNGHWIFDGELIDGYYHVFDILQTPDNRITTESPYRERRTLLERICAVWQPTRVSLSECARTVDEKMALYDSCREENKEGVMFKHVNAIYQPNKRVKTMVKAKFVETCEVIVTELWRDNKEAATVGMYIDGLLNKEVCGLKLNTTQLNEFQIGDVLAVKYLYGTEDFHLVQPVFDRIRYDKLAEECTWEDQVKVASKSVEKIFTNRR